MPPPQHRKKPFSAKQKKEQLKAKRERKRNQETDEFGTVITLQYRLQCIAQYLGLLVLVVNCQTPEQLQLGHLVLGLVFND